MVDSETMTLKMPLTEDGAFHVGTVGYKQTVKVWVNYSHTRWSFKPVSPLHVTPFLQRPCFLDRETPWRNVTLCHTISQASVRNY